MTMKNIDTMISIKEVMTFVLKIQFATADVIITK